MASLAGSLIDKGYNVVPLNSSGLPLIKITNPDTGKPLMFTSADAESWVSKFGQVSLGLMPGLCGVAMLDVDITNKPLAEALLKYITATYPTMPVRRCNPPKFALIFGTDESLESVGNGWSDQFQIVGGDTQWIEYAGWNKIVTIKGTHRTSGNAYSWGRDLDPEKINAKDLPILSKANIDEIFARYHSAVAKNFPTWEKLLQSKYTARGTATPTGLAGATSSKVHNDDVVEAILAQADGETRMGWIGVGRALHENYRGSAVGLSQWDLWSQQWDSYEQGACAIEWEKFVVGKGTTLETVKSDITWEKKVPANALSVAEARYVLIEDGSMVGDLESRANEALLALADFRNTTSNILIEEIGANGKAEAVPMSRKWMGSPDRKTVHGVTFAPGKGRMCMDMDLARQKKYWNIYCKPIWETDKIVPTHVDLFLKHLTYLFGDEVSGVQWFTNWLAHMIQVPWERADIAPIHISSSTGTGRGWLSLLIVMLVGKSNTSETSIAKMCDDGAKNGYLANSIFCLVPEVREAGAKRYSVSESVKKQITDEYINVDIKYGQEGMLKIYTRFFFQSNHRDAMVIDDNDRRFNVFANHKDPMPDSYYDTLHAALKDSGFVQSIYGYLMDWDLDQALLRQVLPTKARASMIAETKSATAIAYVQFKKLVGVFTLDMALDFFSAYDATHAEVMGSFSHDHSKELKHLHREYVKHDEVRTITAGDGKLKPVRVMSFLPTPIPDNHEPLLQLSITALQEYYNKWSMS